MKNEDCCKDCTAEMPRFTASQCARKLRQLLDSKEWSTRERHYMEAAASYLEAIKE